MKVYLNVISFFIYKQFFFHGSILVNARTLFYCIPHSSSIAFFNSTFVSLQLCICVYDLANQENI